MADARINCNNCPLNCVEVDTLCERYCSDMADFIEEIRADTIEEILSNTKTIVDEDGIIFEAVLVKDIKKIKEKQNV